MAQEDLTLVGPPLFSEWSVREFYKSVLPDEGPYCVFTAGGGSVKQYFADDIDLLHSKIEELKANQTQETKLNIYFAAGQFLDKTSRLASNCTKVRSFFIDIDCKGNGAKNSHATQADALAELIRFCKETSLPRPVVMDSGNGIWAIWPLEEGLDKSEWLETAQQLKFICHRKNFVIDPSVTQDAARVIRCPDTINWNGEPKTASLLTKVKQYKYENLKAIIESQAEALGHVKKSIFQGTLITKPDPDTEAFLNNKNDDYVASFRKILELGDGGCQQINLIAMDQENCPEPLWRAGLSVAHACKADGTKAIHFISKNHSGYTRQETEAKAAGTAGPFRCETFEATNPGGCSECVHIGRLSSPIQLGRVLKELPKDRPAFPDELFPFMRGPNGGIYYQPAPEFDKQTKQKVDQQIELIYENDIEVSNLYISSEHGVVLQMKVYFPKDEPAEFYMPLKFVGTRDKFKELMSSIGVVANLGQMDKLAMYTQKWAKYLQSQKAADKLRDQLGWDEENEAFAHHEIEYFKDGREVHIPPSPITREIVKGQKPQGTLDGWKAAFNGFNVRGGEVHQFAALTGFGTPLMKFTQNKGCMINLFSKTSGHGKTICLYASLSVWGSPEKLMVGSAKGATVNAMFQRMAVQRNTPFVIDEGTNFKPEDLSDFIYQGSMGSSKVRMNSSSNSERANFGGWALLTLCSANEDFASKLDQYRKDSKGEAARLIQLALVMPEAMKANADILHQINFNYGQAASIYIRELVKDVGAVAKIVKKWDKRFTKDFGAESKDRFWVSAVSATMAGGEIAQSLDLHRFDLEKIYSSIVKELRSMADEAESNVQTAEDLLAEFINLNMTSMLVMPGSSAPEGHRYKNPMGEDFIPARTPSNMRGLVMRVEKSPDSVVIAKTPLSDFLAKNNYSTKEFETTLIAKGILQGPAKKIQMSRGWRAGADNSTLAYTFKYSVDVDVEAVNE